MASDTLVAAQWLADAGCSVIPIDHPDDTKETEPARIGKTPVVLWKQFQKCRPTREQLHTWFGNGRRRNIGIVTGAISNLVVIDLDSPEALTWAESNLPATPWSVRTRRGQHRGYQHPGVTVQNRVRVNTGDPAIKIDVRADGGYVVAPGSVHLVGVPYEWVSGPPDVAILPTFDPAWLSPAQGPEERESKDIPSGCRNDTLFKEGCRLRNRGFESGEIAARLKAINELRCKPPLQAQEVEAIAESCARYEAAAPFALSEFGDAECFAEMYQHRVRHDHRRGRWLLTDEASGIWVPDPVEQLTALAAEMTRERQRQALSLTGDEKKCAMAWALKGEGRTRLTNTLALARAVPPLADDGEHWDEKPLLLGTPNGVIDLRAGQLRKATAADRVTMRVRAAFDPVARCPLWIDTLRAIFAEPDGGPMVAFMQRALGYSITGDCREECCFFAWGAGGNGKGTVMNTLGWLFGDYTDDMPYSTLERSARGSGIPNDLAKLDRKRFITCSEVNEFNLNEARLKALTGRDPITARFLNREFFTFIPVCKIWIATNNKPKIVGQDDGIWRRIHLIPFTQTFEGREDKHLKDKLRGELPGILNWVVEGAGLWLRDGLNPPQAVKAATAVYRQESNPVTPFVEACCVTGPEFKMQAAAAFREYERFSNNTNLESSRRLSNKAFFKALEHVFPADRTGRQTFYQGVALKAPNRGPGEEF